MRNHSVFGVLKVVLISAFLLTGCLAEGESALQEQAPDSSCEGASSGLGELSCSLGKPVNESGLTPDELGLSPAAQQGSEGDAAKLVRTYVGRCTGYWGGCSRVVAEGWIAEACGYNLFVYMDFDGPYGNLIGYGTGYCW